MELWKNRQAATCHEERACLSSIIPEDSSLVARKSPAGCSRILLMPIGDAREEPILRRRNN